MKKMMKAVAALALMWGVSCSQDPAGIELPATADGGSYKLTQLTATLEGDTETRTSLQTSNNNVVYWTAKDRILLVNTTTYDSWYYELVSGAGSSIGQFAPLNGTATAFSDLSNLVAVYPAVAAVVDKSGSKVSFTINHDWKKDSEKGQTQLDNAGIRSWNNDSPVSFTNNDIKVAYHVNGDQNKANFKFKQLGTWCTFSFDFTSDETIRKESLQSIEITTVDQDVQISGTQEIDFKSDPVKPTLKAKSSLEDEDKSIKWQFNTASSMSTAFTRSVMLFPGMEGKQMKITAQTSMHTFVFYAKPTVKLEPGTTLKFPIGYGEGQNFNEGTKVNNEAEAKNRDFAYTVQEKALYPFYYYGDANCYLITSGTTATIDVTPHQASPYYEKNAATASDAPKPTYAKVIWYETELGQPTIGNSGNISGNSFTVTLESATKYGNALIGIYENQASTTPLWSYHIWHPEDDPTLAVNPSNYKAMKLYENTYSGSYTVMPMALGATKVVKYDDDDATKLKGSGLWYQWGRKDPLGRLGAWNNTTTAQVTVLTNTVPDVAGFANSTNFFVNTGDGLNNRLSIAEVLYKGNYVSSLSATTLEQTEVEQEIGAGQRMAVKADRYVVNTSVENPTKMIYVTTGTFNNDWRGLANEYLWGNPQGYEYPVQQATYKSVFDPCPKGYRVGPRDLWINFMTDTSKSSDIYYFNVKNGAATGYNKGYECYYKGMGTTSKSEDNTGIGYTDPDSGLTDYYPATGYRGNLGTIAVVGTGIRLSSSTVYASGDYRTALCNMTNTTLEVLAGTSYPANCHSIRCVKEVN